ncbi:ly6/PLAUR domain-containing protein 8 [Leptonychotes weddellii]|uniref:Ly6/PLAUR domain-containing protein 8 n=1 Tax=Leptonychotes weddellii TaxID=9713 RepID=A0A2U3XGX4_LEPWE|nr:ly6/PLAUR domain-containing protein 8 [Leptonychotes weddellii]
MKGILVAAIITAFVVAAVESLRCVQCNSLTNSCDNSTITECPLYANASCNSFVTNSSLERAANIYQDKACSAENCREERDMVEAFTVHVSDNEYFHFISQCCQGKDCNTTDALAPPLEDFSSNIECPACYGSNESSCNVQHRKCYKEERCVNLVAEFKTDLKTKKLVLRGCSNISNSTCQFLSAENRTVGGVIFRKFECVDSANSSSTAPPPTPPASSSNASSAPTSNELTTLDTGSKVSFTPAAFVSLLLLRLLF